MATRKTIVTVKETGDSKLAQRVEAGSHILVVDEPVAVGGGDTGPAPLQLMLASLGSCTSMTLRLYAARKGWELGEIQVETSHSRVAAVEGATPVMVDRFERRITVAGPLSEEQRLKLVEIAEKCPMHRLLMSTDKISETEVA